MKRKLPDTSHDAYLKVRETLSHRQVLVLGAMKMLGGKATNQQIADYLKVPIHTVSPRTGELMIIGKIERGDRVGGAYQFKLIMPPPKQLNLNLQAS